MGLAVSLLALMPQAAQAQTVEQLQSQIDELKAQVQALTAALSTHQPAPVTASAAAPVPTSPAPAQQLASLSAPSPDPVDAQPAAKPKKSWYDRLSLRGYTCLLYTSDAADE